MELAAVFNPVTANNGTFNATTLQTGSKMIVINKSYVDLVITFPNGDNRDVLANDRREFGFQDSSTIGNGQFKWEQQNIDYPQTVLQLQNVVRVEVYGPTESLAESYPSPITRETKPNLIPFNIGYGVVSANGLLPATVPTIWPSSYIGTCIAPTSLTGGGGADHFYAYNNVAQGNTIVSTMQDIPGHIASTGKTANDASSVNISGMSFVSGPFSQPGLPFVDTAVRLTAGAYWQLASTIAWSAGVAGIWVHFFIKPDTISVQNNLFGDGNVGAGMFATIDPGGTIRWKLSLAGGDVTVTAPNIIVSDVWQHVFLEYTGTSTNVMRIHVNGILISTATTSGAPLNSAAVPFIGNANGITSNPFNGSMTNVCITLGLSASGQFTPLARYQLAQQALNIDYQNAWISKIEINFINGGTAGTDFCNAQINNLLNTSGLLNVVTPVNISAIHNYAIQTSVFTPFLRGPKLSINGFFGIVFEPLQTVSHVSTRLINVAVNTFTGTSLWDINVYGFNLLGVV